MELSYTQRQFVFEHFNKAFNAVKVVGNKRLSDIYGPTTQTILREALSSWCFNYPHDPEIKKIDDGVNSEKKKIYREVYVFRKTFAVPVSGDEITLEQEIDKRILEKK